jgi:hypothetical protein
MKSARANCVGSLIDRDSPGTNMKKSNVRGPSPSRKARLALGEGLNFKSKPVPLLPIPERVVVSARRRNACKSGYEKA